MLFFSRKKSDKISQNHSEQLGELSLEQKKTLNLLVHPSYISTTESKYENIIYPRCW